MAEFHLLGTFTAGQAIIKKTDLKRSVSPLAPPHLGDQLQVKVQRLPAKIILSDLS